MINILRKRIMDILAAKGWTVQYFADLVEEKYEDISAYTVENICRGKTADPRVSTLLAMSNVLGHSINCLMGQCQHTPEERMLLNNYRACGKHGKSIIGLVAKYEAGAIKSERESFDRHRIPCLLPHGEIHKGIVYDNCETIEIETTIPEAYFAIQMVNNDLAPMYCKDDVMLFENRFPRNGEHAAFMRGDRVYIRKFIEEDGQYRLKCLHNYGEDLVFKRMDQVEYIGTCVGVIRT